MDPGEALAITGPSGSGKSTLLYLIGALDTPSAGTVTLAGQDPFQLNESQQAQFRNRQIGFIFQDHHLLPQCTVLENVIIPTLVGVQDNAEIRARELLTRVGLAERIGHRPSQLSGGERQSIAIARAMHFLARVIILDEPTNNLGVEETYGVLNFIKEVKARGRSILLVTHNIHHVMAVCDRAVVMRRGKVIAEHGIANTTLEQIEADIMGV